MGGDGAEIAQSIPFEAVPNRLTPDRRSDTMVTSLDYCEMTCFSSTAFRAWLAIALMLGLLGCRPEPASKPGVEPGEVPTTPEAGGTLIVGSSNDIPGFNEATVTSSQATTEVLHRMFIRLLDEQPDFEEHPPSFLPRLAESYEWSADHKDLTFHLRRDVLWSDGEPVTAEDVRWTWMAHTAPEVAWDSITMKSAITDVEVIDPQTVRFHFTHAYPGQLVHANEGVILPKHAWSRLPFSQWRSRGDWFLQNMVVSGPYTLESWKPQEELVLKRNPRYYEPGVPLIDRIAFRVLPDAGGQLNQLKSGAIDFVRQVPASRAQEVADGANTQLISFWPPQYVSIIWNLKNPLFEERGVRQALAFGIDCQTIIDTIWYGQAQPSSSPVISSLWAHNPAVKPLPYDPNRSRSLLKELGWIDQDGDGIVQKDGLRLSFELLVNAGNQERIDAAVMIQDQLRRVGVQAQPRILEWNSLDDSVTKGNFGAVIMGLGLETTLDFSAFFHSAAIGKELNFGGYSNPRVDQLLELIRSQVELADTQPYLFELQEILQQDQPQTQLWESKRLIGLSRRVRDATPSSISSLDRVRYWWLYPRGP
jgi:peptide/nickel transport system substrate-binding protein